MSTHVRISHSCDSQSWLILLQSVKECGSPRNNRIGRDLLGVVVPLMLSQLDGLRTACW